MSESLNVHFEDLGVGEVVPLGACAVDQAALDAFIERFSPGWDPARTRRATVPTCRAIS